MRYLAFLPPAIGLYLSVRGFLILAQRKDLGWQQASVWLPNFLFYVGLAGNLFVLPSFAVLWREDLSYAWFPALCLLGWSAQLAYCNCWVHFDNQGFVHHTFFGRTLSFSYRDLTEIRRSTNGDVRLYCGSHMIFLDDICLNRDQFLRRVNRQCKQLRVRNPRTGWDPFCHNVPNGKFLFFTFTILVIFWLVVQVCAFYAVYGPPEQESDFDPVEVVFTDCRETGGGDVYLTGSDGQDYGIQDWVRLPVSPESLCDGRTRCTALVRGKDRLWIYQLRAGDRWIFTLAEYEQFYREDQTWAVWLLLVFSVGSVYIYVRMLQVGRHPERYSPRTRRLYFRDL